MPLQRLPPKQRIEHGSVPQPNGCWNWRESTNAKGYAHLRYKGKMWRANRFSWTAFYGDIPEGLQVLHECDNPLCVNPEHLFLGTNKDNVEDRVRKNRSGSMKGIDHPRAKLTNKQVLAIRRQSDLSLKYLAKQYGVCIRTIYLVRTNQTWTHI